VFLTGTEPAHTCGNGATPPPRDAAKTVAPVKAAPAVKKAALAAPAAPAVPNDSIGDGSSFESLDAKPRAQPTP